MTVLTALFGYFTFLFKRVVIKVCCQNGYECLRKHLSVWQIDWKRYKVADRLSQSLLFSYFFGWLGHSKGLFIPICTKFIGQKTSDDIMTNRRLRFLSIHILFLLCAVLFKRNGRCLMPLLTKHMSIHLFVRELIIQ